MKTNASRDTVLQAIANVNKKRKYQISLNRDEQKGKNFFFTLKTPSKVPGARKSHTGRHMPKASWHAHGFVFEEIFKLDPSAHIVSGTEKIVSGPHGGNWEDRNIGSIMNPCYFSEVSILSGKE